MESAEPSQDLAASRAGSALAVGLGQGASAIPACLLFVLAGLEFQSGFDGLCYGLGLTAGLVLAAALIAPPFRASGAVTVAGFMGVRFGAPARVLSVLVVVLSIGLLLMAELAFAGDLARRFLGMPASAGVVLLLAAALACALPGGTRGAGRAQIPLSLVLAVGYLVPLALLGARSLGWGYGAALPEIARLETAMLEAGLAGLDSFRPHASPFLDIDSGNFAAIVVCLAAGTAALAHIVGRFATLPSPREARLAGAWTALFAAVLLATAPAYAALVKLEIYAPIAKRSPFSELPPWLGTLSRADVVRIHGTSVAMLDDVARAVHGGAADVGAVGASLNAERRGTAAAWAHLKEPVKDALFAAASANRDDSEAARWEAYRKVVLPAAAMAAGNTTGLLTQGGLAIDAVGVMAAVPALTGAPLLAGALLLAAAAAALLATTTALLATLAATLVRDAYAPLRAAEASVRTTRTALPLVAVVAAVAAILRPPGEPAALALAAFSIAASGLFPALVLGLWWRRASAWGAAVAIVAGLALCLTYEVGTRYFPVAFYATWSGLSDAGPSAVRKFHRLEAAVEGAPPGEPKAAARAALAAHAAGADASRVGLANWFGIYTTSAAIFALPVGLLIMVLAGLVTPRARSRQQAPSGSS